MSVFLRRVRQLTGGGEKKGKLQTRKKLCVKAASVVSQEAGSQRDLTCGRDYSSCAEKPKED